MASGAADKEDEINEQKKLSSYIKGVHADLRRKFRSDESNLERVWDEHCRNKSLLNEYADAMRQLAVNHWSKKHSETRIEWCYATTVEYFLNSGMQKMLDKEKRKFEREKPKNAPHPNTEDHSSVVMPTVETQAAVDSLGDGAATALDQALPRVFPPQHNVIALPLQGKVRLLDVGSCYNPFLKFEELLAVGVDISPATESVHHCDFLYLEVGEPLQVAADTLDTILGGLKGPVERLPGESFHVVVFSLLLEYFPSPYQRWICCQKAHKLLMEQGLLLIITPDSHHQNRNAPMMKSWRVAIESMGFLRWRYIKLEHLHCMAFRKVASPKNDSCLVSEITPDMLYIPQDYNSSGMEEGLTPPYTAFAEEDEIFSVKAISELPRLCFDQDDDECDEEDMT